MEIFVAGRCAVFLIGFDRGFLCWSVASWSASMLSLASGESFSYGVLSSW